MLRQKVTKQSHTKNRPVKKTVKKKVQKKKKLLQPTHKLFSTTTPPSTTTTNNNTTPVDTVQKVDSYKIPTKARLRGRVEIPESYNKQVQIAQAARQQEEQLKKQIDETRIFNGNTQPGDYTIYKSNVSWVPRASFGLLTFISLSNVPMFNEWANFKLMDLPHEAWWVAGAGCVAALLFGHNSLSKRWVKRIETRIHETNHQPTHLTVVTGGLFGGDKTQQVPLQAFRGLNASEMRDATNKSRQMISIDVSTPEKYLLLWRSKGHFANPSGLLQKVLGLNKDTVDQYFVTSKGHTFSGKLYSDEDYQVVVKKLLADKQSDLNKIADKSNNPISQLEIKQELNKLDGQALNFEVARRLGILKDEQERELLERAQKQRQEAAIIQQKLNLAQLATKQKDVERLTKELQDINELANNSVDAAIKSIVAKSQYNMNPIVDFDLLRKDSAMKLLKDVLAAQTVGRHPLTSNVKFVFGPDCDTPDTPSNQLKALATQFFQAHTNYKPKWGEPGSDEYGVLTVNFKQKGQFDPDQVFDDKSFANMKEVKL